jgi:hypothetical protein
VVYVARNCQDADLYTRTWPFRGGSPSTGGSALHKAVRQLTKSSHSRRIAAPAVRRAPRRSYQSPSNYSSSTDQLPVPLACAGLHSSSTSQQLSQLPRDSQLRKFDNSTSLERPIESIEYVYHLFTPCGPHESPFTQDTHHIARPVANLLRFLPSLKSSHATRRSRPSTLLTDTNLSSPRMRRNDS